MSAVEQLPNPQSGIIADLLGISKGSLSLTPTSSITNLPTDPDGPCKDELRKDVSATKQTYISHTTFLKSSNITNHVVLNSPVWTQTCRNAQTMAAASSGPMGAQLQLCFGVIILTRVFAHIQFCLQLCDYTQVSQIRNR